MPLTLAASLTPFLLLAASTPAISSPATSTPAPPAPTDAPYVVVLGVAQDGGRPQAGSTDPARHARTEHRLAASIALVDPRGGATRRWLFDATPDLPEQLWLLDRVAPTDGPSPRLDGIFLTHAHVGHYLGLAYLGHEVMGARDVSVWAMPRMAGFLRTNGPWSQLVSYGNVALRPLEDGRGTELADDLRVTPLPVPHRQEFSEVVGFRIDGPSRSVLFLPDIDSWEEWDAAGTRIEDVLATVDVAYVDATFWDHGEIPGRDMSGFPHPMIRHTMRRLEPLDAAARGRVRFLHLNHTNPAHDPDGPERREIEDRGFRVAEEGEIVVLGGEPP